MSRREGLIKQLAWAIGNLLNGSRLTYANVRRYVNRDQLSYFRIRRDTEISQHEYLAALFVAREERRTRLFDLIPFGQPPARTRMISVFDNMVAVSAPPFD